MASAELIAYVDPYLGTIIVQFIVAGVIGSMIWFRESIRKVFSVVTRRKRPDEDETPGEA